MPDTASNSYGRDRARESRFAQIDEFRDQERGQSVAPSTLSLSMMRQAFEGLRSSNDSSLSSSTEQRGELGCSHDDVVNADSAPSAFHEERHSFASVRESYASTEPKAAKFVAPVKSEVSSSEFFNYLTAIGGV